MMATPVCAEALFEAEWLLRGLGFCPQGGLGQKSSWASHNQFHVKRLVA